MTEKRKNWLIVLLSLVIVLVAVFLIVHGQSVFPRGGIRNIRGILRSTGNFSALAVLLLITLSTAIPPLPLPIPLIEIASGIAFGFLSGFLIVWFSQVISSLLAFYMARKFGNRLFKKFLGNRFLATYKEYLSRRGGWAVFYIRAIMAAPFNIISFLAGLSEIDYKQFLLATAAGTIPESLIFTYLGSQIRTFRPNLWILSTALIALGAFGLIIMLTMNRRLNQTRS